MRYSLFFLAITALAQAQKLPPLESWLNQTAQLQLAERKAEVLAVTTTEAAVERQRIVREKLLKAIGGLPDYKGPLNARITGKIDAGAYVIEKVVYESLPKYFVTADLYRPQTPGKHPAILYPMGHWAEGKPAAQLMAANLAMKGFVVLVFDPMGQGERLTAYDARLGASLVGGGVEQHWMAGTQSILIGETFARYRIWDAKRSLDYLVSRPEVDADRIGVTGCSGGGTVTTYISALDPRVKVAAPACYIQSFEVLFAGPIGDSEQSLPGFISSGLDITDYIELFAPKPWLIASTEKDFFTPAGAKVAFDEARGWYKVFGVEDRIKWVVGPGGHGTPLEVREAIYEWMIKWLKDGKGSKDEEKVHMYTNQELQATKSGQVAVDYGSRDLQEILKENLAAKKKQGSVAELRAELNKLIDEQGDFEFRRQWLLPAGEGKHPGVIVVETGANLSDRSKAFQKAGAVVLALWPRGLPAQDNRRYFAGEWSAATRAWLVGKNLPAMRAADIRKGVEMMAERPDVSAVYASATDVSGIWLLMAAAVDQRIAGVWVDRTPYSYRASFDRAVHKNMHEVTIPGFALHWDIEDMVKAMDNRKVLWTDPTDWMQQVAKLPGKYEYRYFEQPDEDFVKLLLP